MKLSLPANISKLRKEHAMTQEQLAEALGVTFASVSKWERGVATPELNLIAEMADLFGVSFDAIVGFEVQNGSIIALEERIHQLQREKNYDEAITEAEKALIRYPNDFRIVYRCGELYSVAGMEQNNVAYSKKALSLYNRACMLIKQNEDPEISDIAIRKEMAKIYLALGEYNKGVELLKQNNPCRMNHPLIGQTLASSCDNPDGALPYLSMALLDLTVTHMEIVMGYINVFCKTKDYSNALALVDWALAFYPGLKNPEKRGYMDKNEAILWTVRADILLSLCKKEEAIKSLRQAKKIALRFDEAPNYNAASIRFVSCQTSATAFDDLGDTALIGVDDLVASYEKSELLNLWRIVKDE